MIQDQLREVLGVAIRAVAGDDEAIEPELLAPKQKDHGDFATNVALALAGRLGRSPRDVAAAIVEAMPAAPFLEKVEVAGPGFINLFVTDDWLHDVLRRIAAEGPSFGRAEPNGRRVQVEFVSANPTGPLHIGHARNAVLGDAIARLFEAAGWTVEREYYFNDAGGQMDRFGASVEAAYLQLLGRDATWPDDGYHGSYITDLARDVLDTQGPGLADLEPEERLARLRAEGVRRVLPQIEETLARFGVRFDTYLSETSLAEKGEIDAAVQRLREGGYAFDAEGAVWFRSTAFGDDKDRVLVRSNGMHTYFAADCAYVLDKFSRGFDHLVYVWGADHHGDVARMRGVVEALGLPREAVEIVIYQWVSFLRGGEPVAMSKRAGTFVTIDELIDEVGVDAARFHLLLFSPDATMSFDIETVARESMENPVYYVQYGHARIASILRKATEASIALRPVDEVPLALLTHESEADLLRALADAPGVISAAASLRAPHRVAHAAQDLAGRFHRFYTDCRVVSDDEELTQARLWLCHATKQVLANLLALLGVSAPERMDRADG